MSLCLASIAGSHLRLEDQWAQTRLLTEQFAAMDSHQLVQQLVESFTALADEVQDLTDRKTILEHKLRYAHEQVCIPQYSVYSTAQHTQSLSLSTYHLIIT